MVAEISTCPDCGHNILVKRETIYIFGNLCDVKFRIPHLVKSVIEFIDTTTETEHMCPNNEHLLEAVTV